jgi:hypothetical protein
MTSQLAVKSKAKRHGGARSGAGRPRTTRTRRNIAITDELYEYASRIGARVNVRGGVTQDASDGIERALRFYQEHATTESLLDGLAAKGVIKRPAVKGTLSPFKPVQAEGHEPVSEMIIRERR